MSEEELKEEKILFTNVNVIQNAPDPRTCNKSMGAIQTDEEKKALENLPQVSELLAKKKAAMKRARSIYDEGAFSSYIFRVLKKVNADSDDGV